MRRFLARIGVVMEITTPLSDQLTRYMDLAAAQLKATATNMANVDTPGFHTVGFDFEAEMRRAMTSKGTAADSAAPQLQEVGGLLARPDGNNVSMDREGLGHGGGAVEVPHGRGTGETRICTGAGCDPCRQQVTVRKDYAADESLRSARGERIGIER